MDIIDKVLSHAVPIEVFGGVLVAFVRSKVCQLLMSKAKDFTADILLIVICSIWDGIVVQYILPLPDKDSIAVDPGRLCRVSTDFFIERVIESCIFDSTIRL